MRFNSLTSAYRPRREIVPYENIINDKNVWEQIELEPVKLLTTEIILAASFETIRTDKNYRIHGRFRNFDALYGAV